MANSAAHESTRLNTGHKDEFRQINELQRQGRVQSIGPADYRPGTQTHMWLSDAVSEIADAIVRAREAALGDRVGQAPRHIND